MREPMDSDKRVAYHEAGHAVAAWYLDKSIISVMLPSVEGHPGGVTTDHTTIGTEDGERYRFAEEANSLYYAAGPAAERVEFHDAAPAAEQSDEIAVHPPLILP